MERGVPTTIHKLLAIKRTAKPVAPARDHLPRKLHEAIEVNYKNTAHEVWSDIRLNDEIAESMFSWSPPDGWDEWSLPNEWDALPKQRSKAPAFALTSTSGEQISLADYEGNVVLLNFWRLGCPPCRVETALLQELYTKYREQGLVVLRINVLDDRQVLLDYLNTQ